MYLVQHLVVPYVDRRIGGLEKQWLNQETKKTVDRRIGGLEMRKGKA